MKVDKEYQCRMDGMIYALKIAKEQGIEALQQEIKKRGILKADIKLKKEDVEAWLDQISQHIYNNMLIATCYALNREFGFAKERLNRFKAAYDKETARVLDFSYLGEHYVKLEDYATELNERFNLGVNVEMAAACQDLADAKNPQFKNKEFLDGIINTLNICGHKDAAKFLEDMADEYRD